MNLMENFIINITQFFIRIIRSVQNIASSDLYFYPDTISHKLLQSLQHAVLVIC